MSSKAKVPELSIIYLPLDQLTPYENNTRKHAPSDVEAIKKSILDDGFNDPIAVWGKDNIIVEGHGRLLAAKELMLEEVPVIRLDHMTDKQRREYAIRHNKTAELSVWDFEKLEEELAALAIEGQEFPELHFSNFENMEIPDDLDSDEPEDQRIYVKFTFLDYKSYIPYENELKALAEEIGAEFGLSQR